MHKAADAIGVFDSGVGGLTVQRRIRERLPEERVIYLGDTARVPYGTKSAATVVRYARACAAILMRRGIKLLVVACNTASAHALENLREELPVPVLGVVDPGAHRAVAVTRNGRIGVVGTVGTIGSGVYQSAIARLMPEAGVFCRPCPLFVPLAEEGWTSGPVPRQIAEAYLQDLLDDQIDTLVLGCTHYPLLKSTIAEVVGEDVTLVDSAEATARVVEETIVALGIPRSQNESSSCQYLVTDSPERFAAIGGRFVGGPLEQVEWVDFE